MKTSSSLNVYDRISIKARTGSTSLDAEERDRLEDLLIDSYSAWVSKISDEDLLEHAVERGEVL